MYSTPPIVDLIKGECDNCKPQAKTHPRVIVLLMNSSHYFFVARSTMSFVDSRYRVMCTGQDPSGQEPNYTYKFSSIDGNIRPNLIPATFSNSQKSGRERIDISDATCEVMTHEVVIRPAETTS